jgi:hypothetical protein
MSTTNNCYRRRSRAAPFLTQEDIMPKFACEVLFRESGDPCGASRALREAGCSYHVDPFAVAEWPIQFGFVEGISELPETDLGDFVHSIIAPYDGEALEWAYGPRWEIEK